MRPFTILALAFVLSCLTGSVRAQVPVINGQVTSPMVVDEDHSLTIQLTDLTVTDSDNSYPADFTLAVLAGSNYSVSGNTITPAQDFYGALTVNVTVNDGTNTSTPYGVSVSVTPENDAPVITGQNSISTAEETAVTIVPGNLLVTDPDNSYPSGFILTASAGSNYSISGNTITPATDFNGTLNVPVIVNDGTDNSNLFLFQITVTPVNDPPTVSGQNPVSVNEDTPLPITLADLLVSDVDNTYPDDFTLSVLAGANYTFSGNTITPALNYNGTLSVNVKVNDGTANSAAFPLQVTVNPVNDAPIIAGQSALSTIEDNSITVAFANLTVTDPDNTYPTGFTLTLSPGSNYTISGNTVIPNANFNGTLSVGAIVNDGSINSNSFAVQISVTAVNDPPQITGQNTLSTNEDTPIILALGNLMVTDPDNTYPTGFTLIPSAGANYTLSGNTVTPAANYNGILSVPVMVNDGTSNSNSFSLQITVIPVNDAPVITGQAVLSVNENQALTLQLTDLNVTDPDDSYPTGFSLILLAGTNYTASGAVITPAANFFGTLSVNVRVSDGNSPSATFSLQVTVNHVNVAPTITGQAALSTAEDTPIAIALGNLTVTDPDNTYPSGFSLSLSAGANYTISGTTVTPALNYNGVLTVGVIVNDGTSNSNSFALQINVTPVNDPPVINGQNPLSVNEDTPLAITLADLSVTDPDNSYPTGFTLTILAGSNYAFSGSTITPQLNYNGTLSVNVRVNDGAANSAVFPLQITVNAVNDAPVINSQNTVTTPEETPVNVQLTDLNVTDVDNTYPGSFTYTFAAGSNYTVSSHTVTPALNFNGTLSVPVTVNDGTLNSNTYSLQITVTPVNDPPVITGQSALTTNEDTPIVLQLSNLTVTDPDNTYPTGFSLTVLAGSNYSFSGNSVTPDLNYNGSITVNVKVNDGNSDSAPFGVAVTVTPVNDAPVITGQAALTTGDGQPIQLALNQLTVFDPDNSYPTGFTLSVLSGPNYSVSGDIVTPSVGYSGNLPVKIFVNDGSLNSAIYTLTIQVNYINKAPVISGQKTVTINEDIPYTVKLADLTVTDPDNVYPTDFTVTVQAGTNYTFSGDVITPAANFNGTLSVKVIVNDGSSNSPTYNLLVTVNPVNDAPVITAQSSLSINEDSPITVNLSNLTVTDVDNTYPTGFTLTLSAGSNYSLSGNTVTPALNYNGVLSVNAVVNDGAANSNTFALQITVNPVNDAPVISGQVVLSTPEDTPITVALSSLTVTDPDNSYPTGFTLSLSAGANYTFSGNTVTPASNFNGTLTIPVTVNDGALNSTSFNLKITVTPVNDPPVITGQVALTTNQNQAITLQLANLTVTDPDNSYPTGFTLSILSGPNYTFSGTTVSPSPAFSGTLSVNVMVNDGTSNSAVFALTITVNHVNVAPVITGQSPLSVNEDNPIAIQLSYLAVTDPDNTYPTGFTLSLSPGTNYTVSGNTITPALNFNGTLSVGTVVNDGLANSNSYNLQVTVVPVNDAPTSKGFSAVSLQEDFAGTTSVNLATVFTDVEDASSALTYSILNNDKPAYFSSMTVNQTTDQLQFTLAPNANGTAKVTIRATDTGGLTVSDIVTIVITPVNDPPSFDFIGDVNIVESAGLQTVTITNISAGPLETENLLMSATSGNVTLIPQPTITYNGTASTATLTFTPVAGLSGTAIITVKVVDTGLNEFSRTFNVNVTNVNDPPTLDALGDIAVLEDAAEQDVSLTGITAGPQETQILQINVTTDKPALFELLQVNYTSPQTTGVLKIKPAANANGVAVITLTVTDNGPNAPAPNKNFITRTFTMTIQAVNDLPVFTSQPVTGVVLNDSYLYKITVTDADGDPITIAAIQKPSWSVITNQSNGQSQLTGVASPAGSSTVKLTATDPSGTPVEQDYTLIVNTRPVINSFPLTTAEDIALPMTQASFAAAFTDADGNTAKEIQFTKIPRHGNLVYNGNTLTAGAKVLFSALPKLFYIPAANYNGKDTIRYNARDTISYSLAEATISLVITPVNDPPVVTLEADTDSLVYEVGSGPVLLTTQFNVSDVDSDSLVSADVEFKSQNFQAGSDLLGFNPGTLPSTLKFTYNQTSGVLTISNRALIKDYNDAFKVLLYESTKTNDTQLESKTVSISLSDGKNNSLEKDRYIKLVYTFIELTIPSGFTPDGDGYNPTWKIALPGQAAQYPNAVVKVYNKRGKVVFESTGLEKEWDGKFNGELVPSDTYFYTIDLNLPFLKKTYRGPLTILYH